MYVEYKCPPRAPIAKLVSVFKRDLDPWACQHNISFTVTGDANKSTIRINFTKPTHVTLFLLSYKPRTYTTSWHRVVNVHTV